MELNPARFNWGGNGIRITKGAFHFDAELTQNQWSWLKDSGRFYGRNKGVEKTCMELPFFRPPHHGVIKIETLNRLSEMFDTKIAAGEIPPNGFYNHAGTVREQVIHDKNLSPRDFSFHIETSKCSTHVCHEQSAHVSTVNLQLRRGKKTCNGQTCCNFNKGTPVSCILPAFRLFSFAEKTFLLVKMCAQGVTQIYNDQNEVEKLSPQGVTASAKRLEKT